MNRKSPVGQQQSLQKAAVEGRQRGRNKLVMLGQARSCGNLLFLQGCRLGAPIACRIDSSKAVQNSVVAKEEHVHACDGDDAQVSCPAAAADGDGRPVCSCHPSLH